jgi:hypothetical protein
MTRLRRELAALWLFAGIVWRPFTSTPEGGALRLSVRAAWGFSRLVPWGRE